MGEFQLVELGELKARLAIELVAELGGEFAEVLRGQLRRRHDVERIVENLDERRLEAAQASIHCRRIHCEIRLTLRFEAGEQGLVDLRYVFERGRGRALEGIGDDRVYGTATLAALATRDFR